MRSPCGIGCRGCWERVVAGEMHVWQARKIANLTAHLVDRGGRDAHPHPRPHHLGHPLWGNSA